MMGVFMSSKYTWMVPSVGLTDDSNAVPLLVPVCARGCLCGNLRPRLAVDDERSGWRDRLSFYPGEHSRKCAGSWNPKNKASVPMGIILVGAKYLDVQLKLDLPSRP